MVISFFFDFWPKGYWEARRKIGFLNSVQHLVGFEPEPSDWEAAFSKYLVETKS